MNDGPWWLTPLAIVWHLLVWIVQTIGLLVLLWFGYRAVRDGCMAGDVGVFVRNGIISSIGWMLMRVKPTLSITDNR